MKINRMRDPLERLVILLLAEQIRKQKQPSGSRYTKVVRLSLLDAMEAEVRRRGWDIDAVFRHMYEHYDAQRAYQQRRTESEAHTTDL